MAEHAPTLDVPDVDSVDRTPGEDVVATVWFENGGAIQFRDDDGETIKEYLLPDKTHFVYESETLESDTTVEEAVARLEALEAYDGMDVGSAREDLPDALLETFGVDLVALDRDRSDDSS